MSVVSERPPATRADPRAWIAATLDAEPNWRCSLSAEGAAAVERAAGVAGGPVTDRRPDEATLCLLRRDLRPVLEELEHGRGFAILRGPAPGDLPDDQVEALYWLVGHALGVPFVQNVQGTLLYDVRDTGQDVAYGARFSVTNADSSFHTDNSFGDTVLDYVGLLCLRTSKSGGMNQLVSGYAACEELSRTDSVALETLCESFHVDRRGGVRPGETPTVMVPIVTWPEGGLLIRYLRYWIHAGHEKAEVPLTPAQLHALDLLDEVLARPDLRAEFTLQPGEMFFINNRWLLHSRTAFEDYPEPERRRHYVRLWLQRRASY